MDENRLLELPQEPFRPMIAQSVQLEQFLGEELIFCFRDLDGVHTFTTCYGDIYKTVNALRDYVRLLESVCDQWELTGFHRATYEYHAEKLRKIADKLQAGIGYDYDKAVERCKKKHTAMLITIIAPPDIFDEIHIHLAAAVTTKRAIHIYTVCLSASDS